jgi:O-antigen/teichoic acid export membrane protein
VILSKMLSLELFGYYSLALVVVNGLYFIATPIFVTYFPRFSQLVSLGDKEELKRLYHQSCQTMSVLIMPVAVVVIIFSREILQAWTGNAITVENTHVLVSLLMVGTLCNGIMHMPYALQLAYEWTTLALYQNIIAVIVLVFALYFGIVYFGVVGATFGWISINMGYVLFGIHIMHRKLLRGEKQRWYFIDVGLPLIGSLTTACAARCIFPEDAGRFLTIVLIGLIVAVTFFISYLMTPQSNLLRKKMFNLLALQNVRSD